MTATLSASQLAAGTWTADQLHSNAEFRVRHFGIAWFRGRMGEFTMSLEVGADGQLAITGSSPVAGIELPNEQLAGHVQSPDFFDAQLYPTIDFASTNVQLADDGTAVVEGTLTMKGTSLPITLRGTWGGPIVDMGGSDRIGLELSADIEREAYGISWNAPLAGGIDVLGPKVSLEGSFELVRQ